MKRVAWAVLSVVFLAGGVAAAHHSYEEFLDETVSVEGTLEKVFFANPHTILTFRTDDSAVYTAEPA